MTRASHDGGRRGSLLQRTALAAGGLLLGSAVTLGSVAGAAAQATPAAMAPTDCAAPAAAPMAMTGMATPAAMAAAMATPGEAALGDAAAKAATNLVGCWNAGNLDAFTALVTPAFLMEQFGAKDAAAAKTMLGGGPNPQIAIVSTGNPATWDDGRASLDVVYTFGPYQYVNARWFMTKEGDQLYLDSETMMRPQPEGDTAIISFTAADDKTAVAFDQRSELDASPVLILHGTNSGTTPRNFALLKMPAGTATPPADMAGVELIGTLLIQPGEVGEMALVNLPAGDYVLADAATNTTVPLKVDAPSS